MANSTIKAPTITKFYGTNTGNTGTTTVVFPKVGTYLMAVGTRFYVIELSSSTALEYRFLGDNTVSGAIASTAYTFDIPNLVNNRIPIVIGI